MNILPNLFSTYFLPLRRIGTAADRRPKPEAERWPETRGRIARNARHERRHAR